MNGELYFEKLSGIKKEKSIDLIKILCEKTDLPESDIKQKLFDLVCQSPAEMEDVADVFYNNDLILNNRVLKIDEIFALIKQMMSFGIPPILVGQALHGYTLTIIAMTQLAEPRTSLNDA